MRLLKSLPKSKIPPRPPGGGRKSTATEKYNSVVDRVLKLNDGAVLPIECNDQRECTNVQMSLRGRGVHTIRRGTTLYASRHVSAEQIEDEKKETKKRKQRAN